MKRILLLLSLFNSLTLYGAQQTINVGATANDGTGDSLRVAFGKANSNFTELYNADAAVRSVPTGGTGQSSYTNGQILIGNTTGNTLAKGTISGTSAELAVTNGAGSITLSLPAALTFTGKTVTGGTFAAITGTGAWDLSSATVTLGTLVNLDLTGSTGQIAVEQLPAGTTASLPDPNYFGLYAWNDADGVAQIIPLSASFTTSGSGSGLTLELASTVATASSTLTFTNKTFDGAGTGNTLKFKSYIQFTAPGRFDGTGAVAQLADSTANYYGQALFSATVDQGGNWVEYRCAVPEDWDTAVDPKARFKFRLSNTDTGTHRYVISVSSVANSAAASLGNAINMDVSGDASGASGDVEGTGIVTLTGWGAVCTAGQQLVIRVARDGDATEDASTVASYSGTLVIEYGATQ